MSITKERREEVIKSLRDEIESAEYVDRAYLNCLDIEDARDILAMIEETPYRVLVGRFPEDLNRYRCVASFNTSKRAEAWGRENYAGCHTITGPDSEDKAPGDPDCPPARLAPNPGTPCITFEPWVQPKPTLGQMPERQAYRGHWPDSPNSTLAARIGTKAFFIGHDGKPNEGYGSVGDAKNFTVLDADPPPPKTLADVPDNVAAIDDAGELVIRRNGKATWPLCDKYDDDHPHTIDITCVLGYPKINVGGSDEQG